MGATFGATILFGVGFFATTLLGVAFVVTMPLVPLFFATTLVVVVFFEADFFATTIDYSRPYDPRGESSCVSMRCRALGRYSTPLV